MILDWSIPTVNKLECYVRTALELGELSPGAQSCISQLVSDGNLSDRDRALLSILRDAIADGCIRQVTSSVRL